MQKKNELALEALSGTTGWLAATIVTSALLTFHNSATMKIFDVELPRGEAGLLFFVLSSCIFIHIYRQLLVLRDALEVNQPTRQELVRITQLSVEDLLKEKMDWDPPQNDVELVRSHSWFLNPFAQSSREIRYIADSLPFVAMVSLWCLGAQAGLELVARSKQVANSIGFPAFAAYIGIGIVISIQIGRIWTYTLDKKLARFKMTLGFCVIFGWFLFIFLGPRFR